MKLEEPTLGVFDKVKRLGMIRSKLAALKSIGSGSLLVSMARRLVLRTMLPVAAATSR